MYPQPVDHQAQRWITGPPGAQRAQKGILQPQQRHATPGRHSLAPRGIGRAAPDHHAIRRPGQTQAQVMPGQLQDAAQPGLAQEPRVVKEKPPGSIPGGVMV